MWLYGGQRCLRDLVSMIKDGDEDDGGPTGEL
jgi:hypothetical protein